MTIYKFIGTPVFNPFTQQWAGVLKVRKYDPYVPLDDEDETVDRVIIHHAADKLGAVRAIEQAIREQIPADCRECGLEGRLPCWKQIPPFEFWLNDEVCPLVSR